MFIHNFKYSLKILLKNKSLLFWSFIFPIILGTLFKLAFSNIEKKETLSTFDIAIVENEEFNNNLMYKKTFETLGNPNNDERLFNIKYVSIEEAKKLLEESNVVGYLILKDNKPTIYVNNSGINETVLKVIVERITNKITIYQKLINKNVDINTINSIVNEVENDIKIKDISSKNLSYTNIEYYTLLAMTSLYGGLISMFLSNKHSANISSVGKRTSVSKLSKNKLILSNLLASYLVELLGLIIVYLYSLFILKVDFGTHNNYIILLLLVGSLCGLSIGTFIASFKVSENTKTGILIAFTMISCFFAGMYGITMKYLVDKSLPFINKINPTGLITDGFYSLYYYESYSRYFTDIISLIIISVILVSISLISLRRNKYDSI